MEWPLFDLRLTCGDVSLRAVTDADPTRLLAIFPDDCEQDPSARRFAGPEEARDRDRDAHRRTGAGVRPLGAVAAVSSARMDNMPSLAVSRRLGYADNGVSLTDSPTGVVQLQHLRLTRERWFADRHLVEISGAAACLPWFGLEALER